MLQFIDLDHIRSFYCLLYIKEYVPAVGVSALACVDQGLYASLYGLLPDSGIARRVSSIAAVGVQTEA